VCLLAGCGAAFTACPAGPERRAGEQERSAETRAAAHPAGAQRAFSEEARIFVVPAAGGRSTALTASEHENERASSTQAVGDAHDESGEQPHGETQVDNPIWSPDGSRIAFTRTACGYCPPALFVVAAEGSRQERLAEIDNAFQPTWSPDGRRIAFLLPGARSGIYVMRVCAGRPRMLVRGAAGSRRRHGRGLVAGERSRASSGRPTGSCTRSASTDEDFAG
jgi:hypothetical protein